MVAEGVTPVLPAEQLTGAQLEAAMGRLGAGAMPSTVVEVTVGAGMAVSSERAVSGSLNQLYIGLEQHVKKISQGRGDQDIRGRVSSLEERIRLLPVAQLAKDINDRISHNQAIITKGGSREDMEQAQEALRLANIDKAHFQDAITNPQSAYRREYQSSAFKIADADWQKYLNMRRDLRQTQGKLDEISFSDPYIEAKLGQWDKYLHTTTPDGGMVFDNKADKISKLRQRLSGQLTATERTAIQTQIAEFTAFSDVEAVNCYFAIDVASKERHTDFNVGNYGRLKTKRQQFTISDAETEQLLKYEEFLRNAGITDKVSLMILSGEYNDQNMYPNLTAADRKAYDYMRAMTQTIVKAAGGDLGRGTVATVAEVRPAVSVAEAVPVMAASREGLEGVEFGQFGQAAYDAYMAKYLDLNKTAPSLEQQKAVIAQIQAKYQKK